jgi:hypothetical protein
MGAWKKLNQQDVYISTYTAKKSWSATSSSLQSQGIRYYYAVTGSASTYFVNDVDKFGGPTSGSSDALYHKQLVHKSLNQLYFQNYDTSSGELARSSSFDVYLESTINTGSRALTDIALVYSIPRNRFGTHIEPGSLNFGENRVYVSGSHTSGGYIADGEKIYDDGEGALRLGSTSGPIGGTVIYSHGQTIITDKEQTIFYDGAPLQDFNWKSNVPIYTYNYTVRLSDNEFNFTQNPSALTGSDNSLRNELTGSYFQPYITTVGLYNDSNELIAVAKLSKPLPKSKNTETAIQIKLDI